MSDVKHAIRLVLVRELDAFCREIEAFPDDELIWQTAPGVSNACGNLALHAAGNLQHFIGARLGATGYVRNRDLEFNQRSGTRAEIVADLRRAREVVTTVLERLSDAEWDQAYPEVVGGAQLPTGMFLVHLTSHLAFHLGQAGYLRRVLTGENRSVGPVAIPALAALVESQRGD
jgi:uncharacterized damage-inducible protein DinB